jgi:hypothetical protein
MPTTNGGQSKLEIAAIAARNKLLPQNTYNDAAAANEYTATHTRAVSDSTTPIYGKGSGGFLDIENYKGVGGDWDINGNQTNSIGSGRVPAMALNGSLWGYGPTGLGMQTYKAPNTAGNTGQVVI